MSDEQHGNQKLSALVDHLRSSGQMPDLAGMGVTGGQSVGLDQLGNLRPSQTPANKPPSNPMPRSAPEHNLGGPYRAPSRSR